MNILETIGSIAGTVPGKILFGVGAVALPLISPVWRGKLFDLISAGRDKIFDMIGKRVSYQISSISDPDPVLESLYEQAAVIAIKIVEHKFGGLAGSEKFKLAVTQFKAWCPKWLQTPEQIDKFVQDTFNKKLHIEVQNENS